MKIGDYYIDMGHIWEYLGTIENRPDLLNIEWSSYHKEEFINNNTKYKNFYFCKPIKCLDGINCFDNGKIYWSKNLYIEQITQEQMLEYL